MDLPRDLRKREYVTDEARMWHDAELSWAICGNAETPFFLPESQYRPPANVYTSVGERESPSLLLGGGHMATPYLTLSRDKTYVITVTGRYQWLGGSEDF